MGCEKGGVVGGEQRRVAAADGRDLRLPPELTVEEGAHRPPVPAARVDEIAVERQVAVGKALARQLGRLIAGHRHVEHGQVEEGDGPVVAAGEIERLPRLDKRLRRCAEQQVHVSGDARLGEGAKGPFHQLQADALGHGVEHRLAARLQPELEQHAAAGAQPAAERRVGQLLVHPDKAVPGRAGRVVGERAQQRRAEGVVEQVEEHGVMLRL